MSIETLNPAIGRKIQSYTEMSHDDVRETIESVYTAFLTWKHVRIQEREGMMARAAHVLKARKFELGQLITEEMGKPISQSVAEIEKCAWVCEHYAEFAEHYLKPESIKTDAAKSYVTFQPIGVVLAVMPWNFPFWQVFRFLAPNLMAGNTAVLKHASNVMGCGIAIEEVIREAGFPDHVFRNLIIESSQVADVISHPRVQAVTLTGSTPAGKAVASKAGEHLKKTVLELGGSDPYIILEDADLDHAAKTCVFSRMINGGQSCIAAKRFIVIDSIKNEFEERVVYAMNAYEMGNPSEQSTNLGPLARFDLRDQLHDQVQKSIEQGARLLCGGTIPEQDGAYYPPTVLTDVHRGMPAYHEELFGPVASIIGVSDEKEAVKVANDTPFGLGAAVFTSNTEFGELVSVKQLEAGSCFVNSYVKSDPRLPFGGIKESGYGRELSAFGIREFTNIKTVYIDTQT